MNINDKEIHGVENREIAKEKETNAKPENRTKIISAAKPIFDDKLNLIQDKITPRLNELLSATEKHRIYRCEDYEHSTESLSS